MGKGYVGSLELSTSKAMEEIISSKPEGWTMGYQLYEINFTNVEDCTVIINGKHEIFLYAGEGFKSKRGDAKIFSFVIKEADIHYSWHGKY